jgi:glucose uptake protein GlcU
MWLTIADALLNLSVVIILIGFFQNRGKIEFHKQPTLFLKIGLIILLISTLIFLIIIVVTPLFDFVQGFKDGVHASSSQVK